MDLYAENILEHFRNPRKQRQIANVTVEHEEVNHSCGDAIRVNLCLKGNRISAISWHGTGCAISQAAMSMLAESVEGKTVAEVEQWGKESVLSLLGVPVGLRRIKCALLCLHTMKNALRKAEGKDAQGWLDTVEIAGE